MKKIYLILLSQSLYANSFDKAIQWVGEQPIEFLIIFGALFLAILFYLFNKIF